MKEILLNIKISWLKYKKNEISNEHCDS
jgi:hypothetical protein